MSDVLEKKNAIQTNYENRDFSKNIRVISSLADDVNKYIDDEKPWIKIKDKENNEIVQEVCSDGINMFRVLIGYLKPVLPKIAENVEKLLRCSPIDWYNIDQLILEEKIETFKPLITRIDEKSIEIIKTEAKED